MSQSISVKENGRDWEYNIEELLKFEKVEGSSEQISCVEAFQSNIYLGTTSGRVLHYYHFDDINEYMLISEINVTSKGRPITKILVIGEIERALILGDETLHVFAIPELSPSNISRIKGIRDILVLEGVETSEGRVVRLLMASELKVRVTEINKEQIKLIRDINYSNAHRCCLAKKTGKKKGTIAIVSNDKAYDLIDLDTVHKVDLFDYNTLGKVYLNDPHIVPFVDKDSSNKEYLLTIQSDELTCMAMFINSIGDVTRGTLLWHKIGRPSSGILVDWPFVISLCSDKSENEGSAHTCFKLVFSSLKELEVCSVFDMKEIIYGPAKTEPQMSFAKDDSDIYTKTEDFSQQNLNCCFLQNTSFPISKPDKQKQRLLARVSVNNNENVEEKTYLSESSKIIFDSEVVRIIYEVSTVVLFSRALVDALKRDDDGDIVHSLADLTNQAIGDEKSYFMHLLFLLYIRNDDREHCKELLFAQSFKNVLKLSKLDIDPRFLLYLTKKKFDDEMIKNFLFATKFFRGIKEIVDNDAYSWPLSENLIFDYVERIYKELKVNGGDDTDIRSLRYVIYYFRYLTSGEILNFIEKADSSFWKDYDEFDEKLMNLLQKRKNYIALLYIYMNSSTDDNIQDKERSIKICELSFRILMGQVSDPDLEKANYKITFGDTEIDLVGAVLNNLNVLEGTTEYGKYLLDILKCDMHRGMDYMKSNHNSNNDVVYRQVMEEISHEESGSIDFSNMKIEYMETIFKDSLDKGLGDIEGSLLEELLFEIIRKLTIACEKDEQFKTDVANLLHRYQEQNSLTHADWPKMTWPKFLNINMRNSNSEFYIKLILKLIELLLLRVKICQKPYDDVLANIDEKIENLQELKYLRSIYDNDITLDVLLEYSDFTNSEYYSLYGTIIFFDNCFYSEHYRSKLAQVEECPADASREKLFTVFNHYLKFKDTDGRNFSVMHFLTTYGSRFEAKTILNSLPHDIPIVYLEIYLKELIIRLNLTHKDTQMQKVMTKVEAKLISEICRSLVSCSELK